MAEITLHPESRVSIRPAIVEIDEEENEVIVGMGTAQEVSVAELAAAIAEINNDDDEDGGGG